MKVVDDRRLDDDPQYRYEFLADFIEFGESDINALHEAAPRLIPALPKIVDAVYEKMFAYDLTKRQLIPRHSGYEGPHTTDLEQLTREDGQVLFRKAKLEDYFAKLLTAEFDDATADYLDAIGKMHTTKGGAASLHTPIMLMNIMLGYITDLFTREILEQEDADAAWRARTLRALNKLLWIQQNFVSRHY